MSASLCLSESVSCHVTKDSLNCSPYPLGHTYSCYWQDIFLVDVKTSFRDMVKDSSVRIRACCLWICWFVYCGVLFLSLFSPLCLICVSFPIWCRPACSNCQRCFQCYFSIYRVSSGILGSVEQAVNLTLMYYHLIKLMLLMFLADSCSFAHAADALAPSLACVSGDQEKSTLYCPVGH